MSLLFQPISFRGVTARNRIWLSPMCQYSCMNQDGMPDDWHLVHLGGFATHGFGLILTEATAVAAEGRISPEDTGIWTDEQVAPWRRITQFVHAQGAVIGIQLAHAGRKASTYGMWSGRDESVLPDDGGWQTVSSTTVPFTGYESPRALTLDEVREIPGQFADAAVVGSALVETIERASGSDQKAKSAGAFIASLKRAMRRKPGSKFKVALSRSCGRIGLGAIERGGGAVESRSSVSTSSWRRRPS